MDKDACIITQKILLDRLKAVHKKNDCHTFKDLTQEIATLYLFIFIFKTTKLCPSFASGESLAFSHGNFPGEAQLTPILIPKRNSDNPTGHFAIFEPPIKLIDDYNVASICSCTFCDRKKCAIFCRGRNRFRKREKGGEENNGKTITKLLPPDISFPTDLFTTFELRNPTFLNYINLANLLISRL